MDEPGGAGAMSGRPGRAPTACEPDDALLIDRVRSGDRDAYGALFERHAPAARRLARRLCRDAHETDDVVSEVFANTLRAIRNGGGPVDQLEPYVLRSIRHTVAKLRTRTDTARATPTDTCELDRPAADGEVALAGPVAHAFNDLPPRFQDVLWMTCVEGRSAGEIGAAGEIDAGAVASLAHRARRALGRSYLSVATRGPVPDPTCAPIRNLLPGFVQGGAAPTTARRVSEHLDRCAECSAVSTEMTRLNRSLASVSMVALAKALVHRWRAALSPATAIGSGTVAPLAAVVVLSGTLVGGGATVASPAATGDAPTPVTAPADDPVAAAELDSATPASRTDLADVGADDTTAAEPGGDAPAPTVGDRRATGPTEPTAAATTAPDPASARADASTGAIETTPGSAAATPPTAAAVANEITDLATGLDIDLDIGLDAAAGDALDTVAGAVDELSAASTGAVAEAGGSVAAIVDDTDATVDVDATMTAADEVAAINGTAVIEPSTAPVAGATDADALDGTDGATGATGAPDGVTDPVSPIVGG